jgi:ABC-type amino acid transport substrate-binding protein
MSDRPWSFLKPFAFSLALFAAQAAFGDDFETIKTKGVLRVLVVPVKGSNEFFPLSGNPPGFDREILEGFAQLHRVKLEPVAVEGWDQLVPGLTSGKGDVAAGRFTVTEDRKKRIAFTSEVFPTRNVVLTRKPAARIETLAQLRAARVGTIRGSSMAEAVAKAGVPPANVDDSYPPGGLPAALASGKVAAVVLGIESAIVARRDDPQIEIGLFVGAPGSLAYGVSRESASLLSALNSYIENLRKTATWSRLVVKYFGEAAPEILKKARIE